MPKLTKAVVDGAQGGTEDAFVWDSAIAGFGLKIYPSGVKSFVYQYRNARGLTRRMTLGKYTEAFTADQARKQAKKEEQKVRAGVDPLERRVADRNSLDVAKLLDLYIASARFKEKAESTQSTDKGRIARHLKSTVGKLFVDEFTSKEPVRKAFASIRDGKTAADEKTKKRGRAIVKGGEGTARMSIRLLSAVFEWAIVEGLASVNPCVGVDIGTDGERDVVLESVDDYKRMFKKIDELQATKVLRAPAADAIRVIALTGARRGEIAGLRWKHVNLKRGVIELPPSQHKTGKKSKKPRLIGLPTAAQAIISAQPEGRRDDFVFQPAKGEGAISLAKSWRLIRETAELPQGIGLHGLRHTLATNMAMAGAQAAEIMTALGHRQLATAQKYVHWAQDARAGLAERAAAVASAGMAAAAASGKEELPTKKRAGRHA